LWADPVSGHRVGLLVQFEIAAPVNKMNALFQLSDTQTTEVKDSSYHKILVEVPRLNLYSFRGILVLIVVLLISINTGSKLRKF